MYRVHTKLYLVKQTNVQYNFVYFQGRFLPNCIPFFPVFAVYVICILLWTRHLYRMVAGVLCRTRGVAKRGLGEELTED